MKPIISYLIIGATALMCGEIHCTTADSIPQTNHNHSPSSMNHAYKTCFHLSEEGYLYAENNLVSLISAKKSSVTDLINAGYIDAQGNILSYSNELHLKSILDTFWSGENPIQVESKKFPKQLDLDFNNFMDRVFEDAYISSSSYELNMIRYYLNIFSAIIDLTHRAYRV